MTKRISVTIQNRRPGDSPRLIKAIAAACPKDADVEIEIHSQTTAASVHRKARPDEQLETEVNRQVGSKLDELARAVLEHQSESDTADLDVIRRQAKATAERRSNIKQWFVDTAREAWKATVKAAVGAAVEALTKGSDPK